MTPFIISGTNITADAEQAIESRQSLFTNSFRQKANVDAGFYQETQVAKDRALLAHTMVN